MIRPHETLLNVGITEPVFHVMAADNIVDPCSIISRSGVDFGLPASIHAPAALVKTPTHVPHDGCFSSLVSFPVDFAAHEQLVEHSSCRGRDPLDGIHAVLPHALLGRRSIDLLSRNIEIAGPDDSLAHLDQIAYPRIEDAQKAGPIVCSGLVALGRTVRADEDESGKFQYDTSAFGVKGGSIVIGL